MQHTHYCFTAIIQVNLCYFTPQELEDSVVAVLLPAHHCWWQWVQLA